MAGTLQEGQNPYTATNATEMAQYLASKYYGAVVKYTGTTGTYTNGRLYKVIQVTSNEYAFEELITPVGSITKTENGTYDVKEYAEVVVNVPSGGGSSTFPIYIRDENGALLHTLNISQIEWGIKWGEYLAVHAISGPNLNLEVAGEGSNPNGYIWNTTDGRYLYSGSGSTEIGITGLMPMGPGDYYLY